MEENVISECGIVESAQEVGDIVGNYQGCHKIMTGEFSDALLRVLAQTNENLKNLNEGLKDVREIDATRLMSWVFLYSQLNEKGLKQIHGHTVESLLGDKERVDSEVYPKLRQATEELKGILEGGFELLEKLADVLEKTEEVMDNGQIGTGTSTEQ